jgi:antitoxin HigA-1
MRNGDGHKTATSSSRTVLRTGFKELLGISINALARGLHVPASRMNKIDIEERSIGAQTAIRLAVILGVVQSWMNLQSRYDPDRVAAWF